MLRPFMKTIRRGGKLAGPAALVTLDVLLAPAATPDFVRINCVSNGAHRAEIAFILATPFLPSWRDLARQSGEEVRDKPLKR